VEQVKKGNLSPEILSGPTHRGREKGDSLLSEAPKSTGLGRPDMTCAQREKGMDWDAQIAGQTAKTALTTIISVMGKMIQEPGMGGKKSPENPACEGELSQTKT